MTKLKYDFYEMMFSWLFRMTSAPRYYWFASILENDKQNQSHLLNHTEMIACHYSFSVMLPFSYLLIMIFFLLFLFILLLPLLIFGKRFLSIEIIYKRVCSYQPLLQFLWTSTQSRRSLANWLSRKVASSHIVKNRYILQWESYTKVRHESEMNCQKWTSQKLRSRSKFLARRRKKQQAREAAKCLGPFLWEI